MSLLKHWRILIGLVSITALGITAYLTREQWTTALTWQTAEDSEPEDEAKPEDKSLKVLELSKQARKNLGLRAKQATPQSYWRKILVPGAIVDRPGHSDRRVTSPAVAVVTQIHAFPGDTVKPGARLFTLRLISEYLQSTQKQLFTSTKERQFIDSQLKRLRPLADRGSVARSKIIDLENQLRKTRAGIQADRQDLLTRGLQPAQIDSAANGKFVSTVDVFAPPLGARKRPLRKEPANAFVNYEVQELNAELGQQVQTGQMLTTLADHSALYIEGHAFKREATLLETATQNRWNVTVEFAEDDPDRWPKLAQSFQIRHLSNSIDAKSRTFGFFIPFTNQSRGYKQDGESFIVWRFRPGQRVRLHVPVERFENVLVLPAGAVVREGPEAYVFQQNGDLFKRIAVNVLHEDRLNIVIANDGSIKPGLFLAQGSAATLNRVLKSQAASGDQPNIHVHADGTMHVTN